MVSQRKIFRILRHLAKYKPGQKYDRKKFWIFTVIPDINQGRSGGGLQLRHLRDLVAGRKAIAVTSGGTKEKNR